jgi:hypothetical protein
VGPVQDPQNTGPGRSGWTSATLVFDPTDLLTNENRSGQTSFTLADIIANSTIEHDYYLINVFYGDPNVDYMRITASLDLFEITEDKRWTIRSKWECPVLNFADVTATTFGSDTATEGMWHQYGVLATDDDRKRVHFRLQETIYNNAALTGSLLQAVGFEPEAHGFGKIRPKKVVEEAVCCVPFTVNPESGEERFFDLPIEQFEKNYMKIRNGEVSTNTFMDMIAKMDKYVLPPVYDFVNIRDEVRITPKTKKDFEPGYGPFAMYFFEFSSELSKQDLANIWQGVMPSIAVTAEKEDATIEHTISDGEIISPSVLRYNGFQSLPNELRWKIFKVKKRANYDYYKMLENKTGVKEYKRSKAGRFSFNYPYDFFSLVELGKMTAEVQVVNKNPENIKKVDGAYILSGREKNIKNSESLPEAINDLETPADTETPTEI